MRCTMEASFCSQEKRVNLYFVRPPEGVSSPCLLAAYEACERFQSKWISADGCLQITPTKQDVFICDPFEGKAFAHLTSGFKCVVVGPRCILSCLHRIQPIPQLPSPIHNTAMRGLVITTTGFEKNKKLELKSLVAIEQEIPIMTGEWVCAVWQGATKEHTQHILATDERFLSHTCPVLYGVEVCVSQLDRTTKTVLKGIIEEHGGTYSAMLEMSKTSVLIVSAPEGDKYTYASKWRIKCLTPEWIYDSVQQGHALPMAGYEVKKQKHSTPNSSQAAAPLLPEVSQCSGIPGEAPHRTSSVDETTVEEVAEAVAREKKQSFSKEVHLGLEAVEALELQEAQKAGLFLDGCKIFLSGFTNAHLEKLRRVLNFGGATRFNQLSEAVSHMVIGKPVEDHLSLVKRWATRPHLVYAQWITESVKLRRLADEAHYTHPLEEAEEAVVEEMRPPQRPATSHNTPAAPCNGDLPMEEEEVLMQYMKPAHVSTATTNGASVSDSQERRGSRMFLNKRFTVSGYSQDMEETFTEIVEDGGGRVVPLSHGGHVHYSMVTSEGHCHPRAEEVVSHYFLEDCFNAKRLLPVEYYHVPLLLPGDIYPLAECCITISTYTKNERLFLENLGTLLGARNQDMFAKKPNPDKDIVSSTHLVCPLPTGNKYQAAGKWGVPAVSADWLIECARAACRVPEGDYRVDSADRPKIARKKVFRDYIAAVLEKRGVQGDVGRNNRSGSLTPSPDQLLQAHTAREMHSAAGLSESCNEEAAVPSMPAPDTHPSKPSPDTQQKIKEISDFFNNPTQSAQLNTVTPSGGFYKKFYEDIKETMKKYKRKPPLQLQEAGVGRLGTQETQGRMEGTGQETEMEVDGPLREVVICSSRKYINQWPEMAQAVQELGGQFLHSYAPEVTHYLFQGRSNDLNRDFRKVKHDGKIIRKYSEREEEMEGNVSQQQEACDGSGEGEQRDGTQLEKEKLSKQLEEIGALAQMSGMRNGGGRGRNKPPGEWQRPANSRHVDIETQPISGEEPESQSTAITWEDPVEREARLHLQDQMGGSREEAPAQDTEEQECVEEEAEKHERPEKGKEEEPCSTVNEAVDSVDQSPLPPPMFVLVGMAEEKRLHYTQVVEGLGAKTSLMFNAEVTHLVAESLSRSERTLAAIASGKWVLHDSYLDHSREAGHFLKEETYAWGNPAAEHLPCLEPVSTRAQLAKAAWRWRCAIGGPGGKVRQRPFQHMVALVHSSKDRVGSFSRMIKAGGGAMGTAKPPYGNLEGITHFFVEMDKAQEKVDIEPFVVRGIPCLKPIFINNYLLMEELPEEENHLISQYKDLVLSMSGHNQSGVKRLRRQ
ncbi:DNA topoisomerase 2-binding protein 1 [Chionoecetes opilio]|uniref:DNA topoisomerase 2-binding protein 1 n=1 Tax=Chionoecetes opilio TaxID=41210 RepID=A0A8J5CW02_CHIOP|nr:DNA topoisomerase 2-binding protein 1 [Chionoecetes opilio]